MTERVPLADPLQTYFDGPEFASRQSPTPDDLLPIWSGWDHAIPWPTPPLAGSWCQSLYGEGPASSRDVLLTGEASLRILSEQGPLQVRVRNSRGSEICPPIDAPRSGATLASLNAAGLCRLEIHAPARWAMTVAYFPPQTP